jgi:hypothetical protein
MTGNSQPANLYGRNSSSAVPAWLYWPAMPKSHKTLALTKILAPAKILLFFTKLQQSISLLLGVQSKNCKSKKWSGLRPLCNRTIHSLGSEGTLKILGHEVELMLFEAPGGWGCMWVEHSGHLASSANESPAWGRGDGGEVGEEGEGQK